mmetsp:Transcript_4937/g.9804  ORF Transcript_4937/g.9804 Transcript_4937/m.9804 type:complete len:219 (-) Transcript_4937:434-1090(-)
MPSVFPPAARLAIRVRLHEPTVQLMARKEALIDFWWRGATADEWLMEQKRERLCCGTAAHCVVHSPQRIVQQEPRVLLERHQLPHPLHIAVRHHLWTEPRIRACRGCRPSPPGIPRRRPDTLDEDESGVHAWSCVGTQHGGVSRHFIPEGIFSLLPPLIRFGLLLFIHPPRSFCVRWRKRIHEDRVFDLPQIIAHILLKHVDIQIVKFEEIKFIRSVF